VPSHQIALIRGINVGRAKRVAMAALRKHLEAHGLREVATLLNSGNIVFSYKGSLRKAEALISRVLEAEMGVKAEVVVVTLGELQRLVASNALLEVSTDHSRLLVTVYGDASDKARFEQIFRDNARAVLSFALSRTKPEEAKDVVAQTFLVAWRRFAELPEVPLPWLISVARRTLADRRRAERRREALWIRLASRCRTGSTSVDFDVTEQLHLRGSIGAALQALRPDDRDILVVVAWRDFTVEQLAEALGCSKTTASVRLHRARRRFATLLDQADAKNDAETSACAYLPLVREV